MTRDEAATTGAGRGAHGADRERIRAAEGRAGHAALVVRVPGAYGEQVCNVRDEASAVAGEGVSGTRGEGMTSDAEDLEEIVRREILAIAGLSARPAAIRMHALNALVRAKGMESLPVGAIVCLHKATKLVALRLRAFASAPTADELASWPVQS